MGRSNKEHRELDRELEIELNKIQDYVDVGIIYTLIVYMAPIGIPIYFYAKHKQKKTREKYYKEKTLFPDYFLEHK